MRVARWVGWTGWAGWAVLAGGAVLCAVGWYGVSGERFAERQIPYLASCTVPGAALIVAGALLLAHGEQGLAAARVEELHRLIVAADQETGRQQDVPAVGTGPSGGTEPLTEPLYAVPGGTLAHRPGCPLVAGKAEAAPAEGRGEPLEPCPVCEPET